MTAPAPRLLAALVAVGGLTACSAAQDAAVERAAVAFEAAVREGDGGGACRLLAPVSREELEQSAQQPCHAAFLAEDLPPAGDVVSVEVFGTMAKVELQDDTLFLTRFDGGTWRVLAAHCSPHPVEPYDCQVKGG